MKKIKLLSLLVPLLCGMLQAQDLELGVHVLPTSVLGDPAMFNITVRNMDEEPANGVEVQVTLDKGLKFSSFTPNKLDFNPETGLWKIGTVERHRAAVLTIIANYVTKDDAILMAEIIASNGIDPDSTPGNGIDTNGNGKIVSDKGDEDDGDAAQNGPFN
ncbi:hypothetical protein [Allomuricauda sp. d1]|uniref:hypothetical protein n=1 Tax=Allomuricauda sp. d1 TaxID=3136725 RepID=UPI0031D19595